MITQLSPFKTLIAALPKVSAENLLLNRTTYFAGSNAAMNNVDIYSNVQKMNQYDHMPHHQLNVLA